MTSALILLDFQEALCGEPPLLRQAALAAQVAERGVITNTKMALDFARQSQMSVIHVRLAFDPSYELRTNRSARFEVYKNERAMLVGSPEAEFVAPLVPLQSEAIITKGGVDAFVGTPLHPMLSSRGISELFLAGIATNLVVESTARHATDLGFKVTVLEDCCASFQPELHTFAIEKLFPLFSTVSSTVTFIKG